MTKTKKALIVVLSLLCVLCLGMFTLVACKKDAKVTLSSIKISAKPTKTVYLIGETFDKTGMKVKAVYSDKSEVELEDSAWTFTAPDMTTVKSGEFQESKNVVVSYTEDNETKTVNQPITITNPITAAEVKAQPTVTEYYVGQTFNPEGMKVSATLQNGDKMDIDVTTQNAVISPAGALPNGIDKVTVTIGGFDISVSITVKNALYVEAETGYKNGALIDQSTGDSGNLRVDAFRETVLSSVENLYASHLKAEFAVSKLKAEGVDTAALATQAATAEEIYAVFGGSKDVYSSDVTVGGEIVSKLYLETVKWLNNKDNKATIDEYVASEGYKAAIEAYKAGTNTDIDEWNYETSVDHFAAHAETGKPEYYLGQNNQGDTISFLFESDKKATGSIAFRMSSAYLYADDGWVAIMMGDVQFNKFAEFYVNGVKYDIDDSVILEGGKTEDGSTNNVLWVNWKEVQFDGVEFVEGRNVIELRIKNHGIAAQESYSFAANIDTLLVNPDQDDEGNALCNVNTYDASKQIDITASIKNVTLANKDGAVVLTVTGTASGADVKGYLGDKVNVAFGSSTARVDLDGTNFTATLDVTNVAEGSYALSLIGKSVSKTESITLTGDAVKIGHITYSLVVDEDDSIKLVTESDQQRAVTGVSLVKEGDKAIYTITGTIANYTEDELSAWAVLDLQENPFALSGSWNGAWATKYPELISATISDGTFTLKYDITSIGAYKYTCHLAGADFKPNLEKFEGEVITIGNKTYQMVLDPADTSGTLYWGCVGIIITEAPAAE